MIAAIYARKSTEQTGVADEQKSVARQIEHASAYATRRGWTVSDEHTFSDDAVSGAEFSTRPGYMRLLNALKPRAPFQILIVSELSRLGREQLETGYAVKLLSQAGVRIYSYLGTKRFCLSLQRTIPDVGGELRRRDRARAGAGADTRRDGAESPLGTCDRRRLLRLSERRDPRGGWQAVACRARH
jgi:hypothetical protein